MSKEAGVGDSRDFYTALGAVVLPAIEALAERDVCTGCGGDTWAAYSCGC